MAKAENYDPKSIDDYDYSIEAGRFRKFLWFCSGTDTQLLKRCPHSERVKAEGIGGVILATAGLALLSGSYAFYTVFGPKIDYALAPDQQQLHLTSTFIALLCGIAWSLVVFNLDRFIVTSTGHGDGTEAITMDELKSGLPRIIMAIFIGICLSAPLEIRVFKSEIDAELEVRQEIQAKKLDQDVNDKYQLDTSNLKEKLAAAKADLNTKEDLLSQLKNDVKKQRKDLEDEAGGNLKTGTPGHGPAWRDRSKNLDKMEAELNFTNVKTDKEIVELKKEIAENQSQIDSEIALKNVKHAENKRKAVNIDGLGSRIALAHELFPISSILLMFLLIIIEVTPVFIKMMFVRGPYDLLCENQNRIVTAKYGIEEYPILKSGSQLSATGQVEPNYHQAKLIEEYELSSLGAERDLSKVAQAAFLKKTKKDIEANPEKYFTQNS